MKTISINKQKIEQKFSQIIVIIVLSFFSLVVPFPAGAIGIYVSTHEEGNIYKIDSETGAKTIIASGFDKPEDMVIDTKGIMYIGGIFTGVKRIDITNGTRLPDVGTNICGPEGPSIDAEGNVYFNTRLTPCDHSGLWKITGGIVTTATQITPPFATWGEGTAFLTHGLYAGCIIAAHSDSIVRSCPPDFGTAVDFLRPEGGPIGIAINSMGDIFISRGISRDIVRYDPNGVLIGVFADGMIPRFLEFDEADNLYVTEQFGSVIKISPQGIKTTLASNLSQPVGVAIPPATKKMPNIRLIDTISTSNIELDSTSFSKQPELITVDTTNNKTIIEWQYDSFSIGQIEDLSFDVILKNPIPGEDRIVNHKLELLYTDVNGNAVRTELGPQSVHVLASAFTTSVFTDKTEYTANENAQIGLSITNLSAYGRTIDAILEIKDIKGNLVTTVKNYAGLSFVSGETKSFQGIIWNTGATPAGDYMAAIRLMEGSSQVGDAKASFKIIQQIAASSKIVSDKTSYSSNETVTLTSTVTSQSTNSTITKPTAKVSVIDPNGSTVFSETKNLPDLLSQSRYEFKSFTNTGINPSGSYTATLEVRQTGELLSISSTSFSILSSLDQAKALSGTIKVDPATIFEKETTTLTYTAQNTGNDIDLPMIQLDILIVDPDTGIAVRIMTDETSLNGREVFQNSIIFDSTGLTPKSYLVVLEGITSGIIQTLASTGLIEVPIPNSAPIANAGADQSGITGQSVSLDGTKSSDPDGDTISYAWHVESVPSGSLIMDTSLTGASAPKPSFIPDIEGIYILSLAVNDGLLSSQQDLVSVFVNPAPKVDIHPETINLKSNGGSKSITGILSSPLLSSFSFFAASDKVTVTTSFVLENRYIDKDGKEVVFTVPQDDYTGDDYVMVSDSDGNGIDDTYTITLKFNRDLIIAGFKDQNAKLKITKPTDLISTIIGNGIRIGSDTNLVISPPEVK